MNPYKLETCDSKDCKEQVFYVIRKGKYKGQYCWKCYRELESKVNKKVKFNY